MTSEVHPDSPWVAQLEPVYSVASLAEAWNRTVTMVETKIDNGTILALTTADGEVVARRTAAAAGRL